MKASELAEKLDLKKLSGNSDKELNSCYISDLLSRVLGGCNEGDIWITVQSSINMVAVAAMVEAGCVILPEGLTASGNIVQQANDEDVTIFTSADTAYTLAKKISYLI